LQKWKEKREGVWEMRFISAKDTGVVQKAGARVSPSLFGQVHSDLLLRTLYHSIATIMRGKSAWVRERRTVS